MARRREPSPGARSGHVGSIPPELLLGPNIETWSRDGDAREASRRWSDAKWAWLDERGLQRHEQPPELARVRPEPWSYYYIRRERPDDLARWLDRHGLPPDWRPEYVGDDG